MRGVLAFFLLLGPLSAQKLDPIQWTLASDTAKAAPGSKILLKLTAKGEEGWHLYSMTTPRPPIATTAAIAENAAIESFAVYQPAPVRKLDPNFQSETETFEGTILFPVSVVLKKDAAAGPVEITANIRYQACTDKLCLPPRKKAIAMMFVVDASAPVVNASIPAGYTPAKAAESAPVTKPAPPASQGQDMGSFLAIAFGFGLASIFTPCVFPMIPITMSYFLNQQTGSRRQTLVQAAVFCLGIVVLFTLLGVVLTAVMGPFGVVQIASNPWINGFIALIFVALAFSLFGAFEITLPSGLLTKLNAASGSGTTAGTLLMGLTFSLTSFACVGPFVGTLLAASVQGGKLQPVMGMVAFASGLALPFFLLALFPSALQKMPRSGGWLVRVKVVFGFVILAVALKYISSVDLVLHWDFLTRERFLAAWIVLFALPGLYLLGLLAMEGVKRDEPVGVGRLLTGFLFLAFAVSLVPGMLGHGLGELDAYVPLAKDTGGSGPASSNRLPWMHNDLPGALEKARAESKNVFVNFTGYACTNCKWMKSNMFTRPEIRDAMLKYVLVELYTDGTDADSEKNQRFQESKFETVAIPFYAVLDAEEKAVATFPGLTKDPKEYQAFLDSGLK